MKRRIFSLLAGTSIAALGAGLPKLARAGVPAEKAALLKTTLTPVGAERAGNADGSIPAWTGGLTQTLQGWTPDQQQPDYFAEDATLFTIDKSNVQKYADQISVGVANMIQKYDGFNIQVYPTHRTAAAPQWVYDNIYQNALNSALDPKGGRFGFSGAYGGIPFPILDDDPTIAGPQVIWNHLTRWEGTSSTATISSYIISNGSKALVNTGFFKTYYPYYDQSGSVSNFDGWFEKILVKNIAPPVLDGQLVCEWSSTNALQLPTESWEMLSGQGRVRKAPELTYDTPSGTGGGVTNFDEIYGFYGSPDRYNWTLVGKKEMFIPYNNNRFVRSDENAVIGPHFVDPTVVRFEKHRVYVVDVVLAPGERNVIAHRRIYVDEDNWHIVMADEWDGNGNFIKALLCCSIVTPNLPGTIFSSLLAYNLQSDQYVVAPALFTNGSNPGYVFDPINPAIFNPQNMAASAQY